MRQRLTEASGAAVVGTRQGDRRPHHQAGLAGHSKEAGPYSRTGSLGAGSRAVEPR